MDKKEYKVRAYLGDKWFENIHTSIEDEDKFCNFMDFMYTDGNYGDPYYIAEILNLPEPNGESDKRYFLDKAVLIRDDGSERIIF